MSIYQKRRDAGAICDVCRSPDYRMEPPDPANGKTKPNFICNSCGHSWQYGYDGGIYAELLKPPRKGARA